MLGTEAWFFCFLLLLTFVVVVVVEEDEVSMSVCVLSRALVQLLGMGVGYIGGGVAIFCTEQRVAPWIARWAVLAGGSLRDF